MGRVETIEQARPIGVQVTSEKAGVSAFHDGNCAAVIWHRSATSALDVWLETLPADRLPETRDIVLPSGVRDAVVSACTRANTPACPERDILIDDICALAEIFTAQMKPPYLRLRLEKVTTNACRKFHVDTITARVVCTYRGTGTQYGTALRGQEPERIFTVPKQSPIFMRGLLWPETPKSNLLHRSPPIAGTGETRLLLVLDPVTNPDVEA